MFSRLLVWMFAAGLTLGFGTAANAQNMSAQVWVVHGIPGKDVNLPQSLPVDVSVGNQCVLQGFTFGRIAGPLTLAPGTVPIAISAANAQQPCSNPPIIAANVPFAAGERVIVVAHLDAQGMPTASKFPIDLSKTNPLSGRITLHHTANAPAVDIELKKFFFGQKREFKGVTNGAQAALDLPFGFYSLTVAAAGTPNLVLPRLFGPMIPRYNYAIFVVGSLANNTLQPLLYILPTDR